MTRNKELAYYFDQKTQEAASTSSRGNKEQKLCIDLLVVGVKMAAWPGWSYPRGMHSVCSDSQFW